MMTKKKRNILGIKITDSYGVTLQKIKVEEAKIDSVIDAIKKKLR